MIVPLSSPVFIGTATRLLEYAVEGRKNYRAELKFGIKTDTGDDSGTIIASSEVRVVTEAEIQETLQKFIGEQKQAVLPRHQDQVCHRVRFS